MSEPFGFVSSAPIFACLSFLAPEILREPFICSTLSLSRPMVLSKSSITLSKSFIISYPLSWTWQVSKHTPIYSFLSIKSMMAFISEKFLPTSLPLPAMVSRQIKISGIPLPITSFMPSAILSMPYSALLSVNAPGWTTRYLEPKAEALSASLKRKSLARVNVSSLYEARFIIYGACTTISSMPCSAIKALPSSIFKSERGFLTVFCGAPV